MEQASSTAKKNFVGIDLGGTNIKIGVLNDSGETLSYVTTPTFVERGPEDATKRMAEAVHEAIKQANLTAADVAQVGLGSPGTLDLPSGSLVRPSNLPGWNFFPIRDKLAEYSGLPVTFAHDGPAAAFAEYWVGAGKGEEGLTARTVTAARLVTISSTRQKTRGGASAVSGGTLKRTRARRVLRTVRSTTLRRSSKRVFQNAFAIARATTKFRRWSSKKRKRGTKSRFVSLRKRRVIFRTA